MPAVVELRGVLISQVHRLGPVGQAQYDGVVQLTVESDGIRFDYDYKFNNTDNIDSMVNAAC
jgi:hypothetical protein